MKFVLVGVRNVFVTPLSPLTPALPGRPATPGAPLKYSSTEDQIKDKKEGPNLKCLQLSAVSV